MKTKLLFLLLILILAFIYMYVVRENNKEPVSINRNDTINFNGIIIKTGDTFYLKQYYIKKKSTETEYALEQCIGDLKVTLTKINDDSIALDIAEEQKLNREYFKVTPPKSIEINDGTCIDTEQLCLDAIHAYCFRVDTDSNPHEYTYEIKSHSTMPKPPFW